MAESAEIKYYLDAEERLYDYTIEGDPNALVLRNRRDFAAIHNTIDAVEVSPVSDNNITPAAESRVLYAGPWDPLKDLKVMFYFFAFCLGFFFTIWVCATCIERCCGQQLQAWARRRRYERDRRLRIERQRLMMAQSLRLWNPRDGRQITLRRLSSRALLNNTRPPVKRNLRSLSLPTSLADELVAQRKYGHPLAVENHGAQGLRGLHLPRA